MPWSYVATYFHSGVRTFLVDASHPLAQVWAGAPHADDGALDPEAPMANLGAMQEGALQKLESSGDPARLLLAALREILFFQLFLAGERIPRETDEALSAAIRPKLGGLEELARGG